jgi:DNA helicase-2/ATP-dependent DNA helicase PcrA
LSQNKILSPLTDAQRRAVESPGGQVLVIAGAGSGKTKTLTHRIAYLLAHGVPPRSIVALTFTNKAAGEMAGRVRQLLPARRLPFIGTFHSFAARILREDGEAIGIPERFTILDEDEALAVMKTACERAGIDSSVISPKTALAIVSRMKNEYADIDRVASFVPQHLCDALKAAWQAYERLLADSASVDFDNLIGKVLELFEARPNILQKYRARIRHILVDEYQDTNRPQYLLVKLIAGESGNVFVVGDDWQAIYSFRGSDFRNILRFQRDWPNATVYFLEENFRSTGTIVEAANHLIAKNQYRTDKHLFTKNPQGLPIAVVRLRNDREEAEYVVSRIDAYREAGHTLAEIAVFFRTHAQSRIIEELCMERGIPYRLVGGFKFYKRREVRDLIAYLRVVANPRDRISLARIVNVPPRGIGRKTIEELARINWELGSARAPAALQRFFETLEEARRIARTARPSRLAKWLLRAIDYQAFLDPATEEGRMRWENVQELVSVASSFDALGPQEGLTRFLETVSLLQDADEYDDGDDRLTLMTIHAAKGLEFPIVFLIGCEEGIFPHANAMFDERELEEERRLAYVALTRAKKEVHLTHAKWRVRFGAVEANPPSRFLSDIPEHLTSPLDQLMLADGDDDDCLTLE